MIRHPAHVTPIAARAALFAAIVLAAGCSTLGSPLSGAPSTQSQSALAARPLATTFTAAGRVAARVSGASARGFSGGFSWAHRAADDTIELLTPLGQIAARINLTPAGATIELPDGTTTSTSDPEGFLTESFGVALPLAALPSWLQGVPVRGAPYRAEADAVGRPSTIWQNGWQIQYTEYSSDAPTARPTRIQLNQGNVDARMIVSEWSAQ
jgi:outer membrane lipoprotein LolB